MSTSSGSGTGVGTSSRRITSGGPNSRMTMAFMALRDRVGDEFLGHRFSGERASSYINTASDPPQHARTSRGLSGRPLIEEHPVDTELTDRRGKGREVYRLAHVAVRSELVASQHVFVLARGRENDDGDGFRAWIGAHALEHVESAQLGKLEVEHDHSGHLRRIAPGVSAAAEEEIDRFAAVAGDDNFVREIGLAQRAQRKFLVGRIVLDEENRFLSDGGFPRSGLPSGEAGRTPESQANNARAPGQ